MVTRRTRKGGNFITQKLRRYDLWSSSSTSLLAKEIKSTLDFNGINPDRKEHFNDLIREHKNVNRKKLFRDLNKLGINHFQYVAIVDALQLNDTMQLPLEVVLTIIKSMLDDEGIKHEEIDNFKHFMNTHQINLKKLMKELYELNNEQIAHILSIIYSND